ncbi:N-acetylglucosamine kinase [Pseudarthrobacter sp. N5]|uniref:N-acetylglucosamine kinase n=1 Tax=Pseudarthrobacter sp. N5 TaxID=3418416 RepID=UPI003CF914EB
MESNSVVLVADIGKSRCRVELREGGVEPAAGTWRSEVLAAADSAGFPGLGMHNGAAEAFLLIRETAARLQPPAPPGLVPGRIPRDGPQPHFSPLTGVGAAVAGVEASTEQSQELARLLAGYFGVPAAVLSDATAAHLGALHRKPGTVLIVGTGAVAFSFDTTGTLHRADGWGPLLGDRGSGRWIGQQGLQTVLEAFDGGPATSLSAHAAALVTSPELVESPAGTVSPAQLPAWLATHPNPSRAMASFAPAVLAEAEAGDAVARGIVDEACRILTVTVARALGAVLGSELPRVALLGGVVQSAFFADQLTQSITSAGIQVMPAEGDGLTGASLAATGRELLQERYIHRDGKF